MSTEHVIKKSGAATVRSDNEYGVVDFHGDALFFHSLTQTRISLSLIEIRIREGF